MGGSGSRFPASREFWHGDCDVDFSANFLKKAHKLKVDWAKAPDPADSDVHVTGIAASNVDVFFCLAETERSERFPLPTYLGAQE